MKTVALVPVKAPEAAKSRLRDTLSIDERRSLVESCLVHVVTTLQASGVDAVAVVSGDVDVLNVAARLGAVPIPTEKDLNGALEVGRTWAIQHGVSALLVVLGDVPALRIEDVQAVLEMGGIVLGPDRHGEGTNLLHLSPPDALDFVFGHNSRHRYIEQCRARRLTVQEYRSETTGLDVDTPDDLAEWQRMTCCK